MCHKEVFFVLVRRPILTLSGPMPHGYSKRKTFRASADGVLCSVISFNGEWNILFVMDTIYIIKVCLMKTTVVKLLLFVLKYKKNVSLPYKLSIEIVKR